jgi:hypothetical protein
MKDLFVPYNIAIGLKEIGFNNSCIAYFDEDIYTNKMKFYLYDGKNIKNKELRNRTVIKLATAPTWDQTIQWFIEKHNLYISTNIGGSKTWHWDITFLDRLGVADGSIKRFSHFVRNTDRRTVLAEGISKAIQLVKDEKEKAN